MPLRGVCCPPDNADVRAHVVLGSLKPTAILLAAFAAYVVPFVIITVLVAPLLGAFSRRGGNGGAVLFILWALLATLGPVVTGYVAARLAKSQPLLHGLLAGALAALVAIEFTGFDGVVGGILLWASGPPMVSSLAMGAITASLFLVGGLAGASLWRKVSLNVAAP